ncbi:MAG: radical SAM protein [Halobacteria archaeon]
MADPYRRVLLAAPHTAHGLGVAIDVIPLGLEYIAAYIEPHVDEVAVIDMAKEKKEFPRILRSFKPDLVGVAIHSAGEHYKGLEMLRQVRDYGVPSVVGGYHATSFLERLFPHADMLVRREGEETFKEIVQGRDPKEILGLSHVQWTGGNGHGGNGHEGNGRGEWRTFHNPDRPFIKDLDSIPFPARHLRRYKYSIHWGADRARDIITFSRGCWAKCTFCCEPMMSEARQRFRSPRNIIREVDAIVDHHKGKPLNVFIVDPNLVGNPKTMEAIVDLLLERDHDIIFGGHARADMIAKYPDLVRKMIRAGITSYEMGIETTSPDQLKSAKKGMKTLEYHRTAAENINRWGGSSGGTFVIGLPGQTEEQIKAFPDYAKSIGLQATAYGIATPYPGTEFWNELNSRGLIFETDWEKFDEMHSTFKVDGFTPQRLEELATFNMARFWGMDTYIEQERIRMVRTGRKQSLARFIGAQVWGVTFASTVGGRLQGDRLVRHARVALEGYITPRVEEYTRRVKLNDVVEMRRFLRILGEQKLQITTRHEGRPVMSLVVKTTPTKVEYIKTVAGQEEDATLHFSLDIEDLEARPGRLALVRKMLASNRGPGRRRALARLVVAGLVEVAAEKGRKMMEKAGRGRSAERGVQMPTPCA